MDKDFMAKPNLVSLNLVTLNCLGVPFVQNTRTRLATIARELNHTGVDVVCLQEVQLSRYVPLLVRSFSRFPFAAFEPFIYAPKGGLMTLSRPAIEQVDFRLYTRRGWWHSPSLADRMLHKGILAAELSHAGQRLVILNTHLTANYDGDWSPSNRYACLEQAQLRQLAAVVNDIDPDYLVIIAGDFNLPRHSWLYDEFVAATGVIDPLDGHMQPTYYPLLTLPSRYRQPIDHVFIRPPLAGKLAVTAELLFEEAIPLISGRFGRVSDHAGIQLNLRWQMSELDRTVWPATEPVPSAPAGVAA
jgi:endonuclease/exonuclease/phosphatase family metal-dependent hydrolase